MCGFFCFLIYKTYKNKRRDTHRISHFGGKGWIRTTEVADDRFTVCSLWPLGNLPKYGAGDWNRTRNLLITNQLLCQLSYTSDETWCLGAESNHRHRDFQSLALPTELPRHTSCFLWKCLQILQAFSFGDPEGARTLDLQRDRLAY